MHTYAGMSRCGCVPEIHRRGHRHTGTHASLALEKAFLAFVTTAICLLKGSQAWCALPGAGQGPQEGAADPAAHPPRRAPQERELSLACGLRLLEHRSPHTRGGVFLIQAASC